MPAAFTRTFSIVIKILNILPNFGSKLLPFSPEEEAVCFQNIEYCVEYFLTVEKPLANAAGITHLQPLSKVCILQR
jgi:hypothetical protein